MTCRHKPTVRIASHPSAADAGVAAYASIYCCDRDACQREAKAWVVRETGANVLHTIPLPLRGGR